MDHIEHTASTKAHALLLPTPFQGHINPFMELGKRLAALGVRVTLVTSHHVHAKILRSQEAPSLRPITALHAHFTIVGLPDGLPDRSHHSSLQLIDATESLEDPVLELVHTLAAQGFPVTCIVADYFLRWSPSLASRASLPEFIFWPQCASMLFIFLNINGFIAAGYNPFHDSAEKAAGRTWLDSTQTVAGIPGLPDYIRYIDLPFQGPPWKGLVEWHKEMIRHRLEHLPKAQGVLVNSCESLEEEVSRALTAQVQHLLPSASSSSIRFVGPLSAASEGSSTSLWEEEVEECMEWLDDQPPNSVIFVAFGSLAKMSCEEQVEELARGLIASGQRFLWVLRKDAIGLAEAKDGMKIEDALPHGFLEETKGMGKVVHWAPQVRVLSHPSVGGFLSHCGWNSMLESINAGVPILGWPSFVDQFPNCRLASHVWRTGLELRRNSLNETTGADVSHGVCKLLQGPDALEMRAHAIQLKKLAQAALDSSPAELVTFANDLHKSCQRYPLN